MSSLKNALDNPIWKNHAIGDEYYMDDNKSETWKIAYYPILEDGKTHVAYDEPRALIEKPIVIKGVSGIDFREVPLRYLKKVNS